MADDIVRIKFGVAGGGGVSGESGAAILRDIQSIVNQIEAKGATKLKFSIDTKSISDEINAIQKISTSSSLGNKFSAEMKQNNADWKALERQMIQVNNFDWNCFKTNLKAQQQEIAANNAEWKRLEAEMYKVNNAEWNGLKEKLSADEKELIANNREWQKLEKQVEKANNAEWNGLKEKLRQDNQALKDNEKNLRDNETQRKRNINTQLQYNNILRQAQDYYNKYYNNIQKNPSLNRDLQNYITKLSESPNSFKFPQDARNQLSFLMRDAREAGVEVESLAQKIQRLFGAHLSTAVAMVGVHLIQRSLRDIYQNVKDIDTAMTELKKVTDETNATYSKFLDNASSRAQKIGSEISDVIQATADFSRLGYNLEDSTKLADAALVYKNVGD